MGARPRHAVGLRGAAPIAGAVPAAVRAALPAGPLFFSLPLWRYSAFFLSALFKFALLSVFLPFPCFTLSRFTFFRPVLLCCSAHRCAFFVLLLYFVSFYSTVKFALFSLFYRILLHLFLTFFTFVYSILIYFYLFCCILLDFFLFHSILLLFTLSYFTSTFFYCILL